MKKKIVILPNTIYGPCSDCVTETLILILHCSSNHTCFILHNMTQESRNIVKQCHDIVYCGKKTCAQLSDQ